MIGRLLLWGLLVGQFVIPGLQPAPVPVVPAGDFTLIQHATASRLFTLTPTYTVTLPNPPTLGNLLVLGVHWDDAVNASTPISAADANGNTYTAAASNPSSVLGTTAGTTSLFYTLQAPANASPVVTVTITVQGGNHFDSEAFLAEYHSVIGNVGIDQTGTGSGTGPLINTPTVTRTAINNLLVFMAGGTSPVNSVAGGWSGTELFPTTNGSAFAHILNTGTSTIVNATTAMSGDWDSSGLSFNNLGSGGPCLTCFYVSLPTNSPPGNDTNPGTLAAPFATIAKGVATVTAGQTLFIRGGTYTGPTAVIDSIHHIVNNGTSWANAVTIAAYGSTTTALGTYGPSPTAEVVVLQPPINVGPVSLSPTGSFIIIQDLILDAFNSRPGTGATTEVVYLFSCDHIRILQSEIKNGSTFGVHTGDLTPNNEFLRNKIHHIGDANSAVGNGHALYITSSDNLFEGNELYSNAGYGFHVYNNRAGHADPSRNVMRKNLIHDNGVATANTTYGIVIAWGDANVAYDNLIFNNHGGAQLYTLSTNTLFANNTLTGNTPFEGVALQYYGAGIVARNNIVFGNASPLVDYSNTGATLDHNLTTDPTFVNAPLLNFHIGPGSLARDTGTTIAAVIDDFESITRPQGPAYDIGAFEFH